MEEQGVSCWALGNGWSWWMVMWVSGQRRNEGLECCGGEVEVSGGDGRRTEL